MSENRTGRKSFARRLSWRVIAIVSAILVAILIVVSIFSARIIEDDAVTSAQHILHGTISDIEKPLNEVEVQTMTVAAHVKMQKGNVDMLDQISYGTVLQSEVISGLAVILPDYGGSEEYVVYNYRDADGNIQTLRQRNAGLMGNDWLQSVVTKRQPLWTPPYYASHRGGQSETPRVTTYGYPVLDADSSIVAIVLSDIAVNWIEEKLASIHPYDNSLVSISCSEDVVIGIDDTVLLAKIKQAFVENKDLQDLGKDMQQGNDSVRRRIGKGRDISFVVYGPLHNGWMLSITCRYREVMKKIYSMNRILLILGLLEILIVFFACRRTIAKMTRPITELSDAALSMAQGNLNTQLPEIKSGDEMSNLRDSFVYMQNSIVEYIENLKTTTRANERMESELNVARNIQMGMLSSDFPKRLHALVVPAREVGGDLYDFYIKDSKVYFAIGDVSGKGVPASLMMAISRAAIRFVMGEDIPVKQMVERINDGISESNSYNMFVTLFLARIDLVSGHMEYCNAGHNPIVIIPPDGDPYFLKAKANLAVGLFTGFKYEGETIDLQPGTRIVAYTDGVNEAERADKSQFGNDRLLAWAAEAETRSLATTDKQVVESLYNAVNAFADGTPQNDDITIMSLTI